MFGVSSPSLSSLTPPPSARRLAASAPTTPTSWRPPRSSCGFRTSGSTLFRSPTASRQGLSLDSLRHPTSRATRTGTSSARRSPSRPPSCPLQPLGPRTRSCRRCCKMELIASSSLLNENVLWGTPSAIPLASPTPSAATGSVAPSTSEPFVLFSSSPWPARGPSCPRLACRLPCGSSLQLQLQPADPQPSPPPTTAAARSCPHPRQRRRLSSSFLRPPQSLPPNGAGAPSPASLRRGSSSRSSCRAPPPP